MSIRNIELKGSSNDIFEQVKRVTLLSSKTKTYKKADYPLFDCNNSFMRSIIAVAIGCDVFLPGCKGIGPKKINDSIQQTMEKMNWTPGVKNQDLLNKMLIDHFASKMNMKDFEFATFCIAFLFEPGVKDGESNKKYEACHYIPKSIPKCIPKSLPRYLEAFKASSTEIFDGPVSSECHGLGSDYGSHRFLLCEGKTTCKKCKADFCVLCCKNGYCNRCYSHSLFLEVAKGDEEAAEKFFAKKM